MFEHPLNVFFEIYWGKNMFINPGLEWEAVWRMCGAIEYAEMKNFNI